MASDQDFGAGGGAGVAGAAGVVWAWAIWRGAAAATATATSAAAQIEWRITIISRNKSHDVARRVAIRLPHACGKIAGTLHKFSIWIIAASHKERAAPPIR